MSSTLGSIIDRIKQQCSSTISVVEIARSLNPIPEVEGLPAVYVHLFGAGTANPNETIQKVTQRFPLKFAVMIAARNYDSLTGVDQMDDTRHAIFTALLGYEPNGLEPIEYVMGGIIPEGYTGTVMWWREIFQTYEYIRG